MKKGLLALLFFVTALGLLYLADNETEEMRDEVRSAAGVASLRLSRGVTAYELAGDPGAETVVLIHGANGPAFVWDRNFEALRAAGLRVLRYDIYGRGYSDRPDATYDLALYDGQLAELLRELKIAGPVHLVGNSMGCVVAAAFANEYPDRVKSVTLIGPAGFPINNPAARLARIPLLSDYIMGALGDRLILAANHKYFFDAGANSDFLARYEATMKYRGLKRAMLSTMRHTPMQDFASGYGALGRSDKRVLLIWGRDDVTFPFAHADQARRLMPSAEFLPVEEAAHLPQYEQAATVNARLIEFLGGRPAPN